MTRSIQWLLAMALVASVTATGCSGGDDDDDDDDDDGAADFMESEPNDSGATADAIGAAATFGGECDETNDPDDYFSVTVGAGQLTVSLAWDEANEANDLDLLLEDSSGNSIIDDSASPPGDSPATVMNTGSAGTYVIWVNCWTGGTDYVGTVTRP